MKSHTSLHTGVFSIHTHNHIHLITYLHTQNINKYSTDTHTVPKHTLYTDKKSVPTQGDTVTMYSTTVLYWLLTVDIQYRYIMNIVVSLTKPTQKQNHLTFVYLYTHYCSSFSLLQYTQLMTTHCIHGSQFNHYMYNLKYIIETQYTVNKIIDTERIQYVHTNVVSSVVSPVKISWYRTVFILNYKLRLKYHKISCNIMYIYIVIFHVPFLSLVFNLTSKTVETENIYIFLPQYDYITHYF